MTGSGLARHPSLRVCAFCQTRLDVHQAARGSICGHPVCRGKHLQEIATQRLARQAEVRRAASAFRTRVTSSLGMADPESLTLAVMPYYGRPVVKLPPERRRQARAHLIRVIREAFESAPAPERGNDDSAMEPPSALPHGGLSCATCRGYCCAGGGTHAYLEATAVRGYIARHPGLRRRAVLRAFLEAIPDASFENSCVYHGRRGCALPRGMRSSTCNRYECTGLAELRKALTAPDLRPVLIVSASSDGIERARLVQPDGTTARLRYR